MNHNNYVVYNMTTIEIKAQKNKTTKNFDWFRFEHESINGSLYLPKGVNKLKVIIEYE